jgi:hypothetical protein
VLAGRHGVHRRLGGFNANLICLSEVDLVGGFELGWRNEETGACLRRAHLRHGDNTHRVITRIARVPSRPVKVGIGKDA